MQSFEFIMVLVSIVIGLGIAEILGVVARILRREVQAGVLHSLWMFLTLFMLAQGFWAAWAYQVRPDWSFADLSVFLLPRLSLFVLAALLSPRVGSSGALDEYFVGMRRRFFGVLIFFLLTASLANAFLSSGPGIPDLIRGFLVLLSLGLASTERRQFHLAGVLVMIFVVVGFTRAFSFSLVGMFGLS